MDEDPLQVLLKEDKSELRSLVPCSGERMGNLLCTGRAPVGRAVI